MAESNNSELIQIHGELFKEVQLKRVFPDSKTFVDSTPKSDPKEIIEEYNSEKQNKDFDLKKFVSDNFLLPGTTTKKIDLPDERTMQEHIEQLWQYLKRETSHDADKFSSLIPLPDNYIIPGGRFREVYYWDSYFTMHGLLEDHMGVVHNMINNFAYLINEIGFIPNGNRKYYLSRSQPPFFAPMVELVANYTNDISFALEYLDTIETEYNFWMNGLKSIDKNNVSSEHVVLLEQEKFLNRYYDSKATPREESFYEDYELGGKLQEKEQPEFYKNIRAACESGWDFSSRWFEDESSLETCTASNIVPVDLNSLLYYYEAFMGKLYSEKGNEERKSFYLNAAENRKTLINKFLWDDKKNFYFDYNFANKQKCNVYSLAACYPLYFKCADDEQAKKVAEIIEQKFLKDGGLISTTNRTVQQWDAPNGWAPLQWLAIKGLRNYGINDLADEIKSRWLKLSEDVFNRTKKMFEKYNVEDTSLHAGGGEYDLQDGFGWTNGVAMALIKDYDKNL